MTITVLYSVFHTRISTHTLPPTSHKIQGKTRTMSCQLLLLYEIDHFNSPVVKVEFLLSRIISNLDTLEEFPGDCDIPMELDTSSLRWQLSLYILPAWYCCVNWLYFCFPWVFSSSTFSFRFVSSSDWISFPLKLEKRILLLNFQNSIKKSIGFLDLYSLWKEEGWIFRVYLWSVENYYYIFGEVVFEVY